MPTTATSSSRPSKRPGALLWAMPSSPRQPGEAAPVPPSSPEFRRAVERLASRLRSYISAGFLARLYADEALQTQPGPPEPEPVPELKAEPPLPPPPKSDHEVVVDELHLTPELTSQDLARIRRRVRQGAPSRPRRGALSRGSDPPHDHRQRAHRRGPAGQEGPDALGQDRFGLDHPWRPTRESCSMHGFESKIYVP